ncbi:MAG: CopG family transcriptional regulator [Oligoflexia bacterium]|nr:CopG family transcriptional regulator [Oligoflexia bacterium]
MKSNYNFSKGKRGALVLKETKRAISVRLDPKAILWLQEKADEYGIGYQSFLNDFLIEQWEKDQVSNISAIEDLQLMEKTIKRLKKAIK